MTTALDLCTTALKISNVLGVGQTASAEDANDAFATLLRMLAVWQSRRWMVPVLAEASLPLTGAASYTVGPGGDIDVRRPDCIDDAFLRFTPGGPPVDYPVAIIPSREDYNKISIKALVSWPSAIYYAPSFPLGQLFVWPLGGSQYQLHIFFKSTLSSLNSLTSDFVLPPEYEEPVLYSLAGRLCIAYGVPMRPELVGLARAGENTIRNANMQMPLLTLPPGLQGRRGGMTAGQFLGGWLP